MANSEKKNESIFMVIDFRPALKLIKDLFDEIFGFKQSKSIMKIS